jgi:hypothetical protein
MQEPTEQLETETPEIFTSVSSAESAESAFSEDVTDLKTENDRLKTEIRLMNAREQIVSALTSERARSPELLFQATRDRLQFDDNGKLNGTDELIAELKKRFPEQFAPDSPPTATPKDSVLGVPSINSGAGRTNSRMPLTKEQLARMKPREITRLDWNEVKQVLST